MFEWFRKRKKWSLFLTTKVTWHSWKTMSVWFLFTIPFMTWNWFVCLQSMLFADFDGVLNIIMHLSIPSSTFSSNLLRVIIACNHLPFSKHFQILFIFAYFQIFWPFSTFLCPFSGKSHPCPYFLRQALPRNSRWN